MPLATLYNQLVFCFALMISVALLMMFSLLQNSRQVDVYGLLSRSVLLGIAAAMLCSPWASQARSDALKAEAASSIKTNTLAKSSVAPSKLKKLRVAKAAGDIFVYQTKAGDTAQSVAFDFIDKAQQKQQLNKFLSMNRLQLAGAKKRKPLPVNKSLRIPFSMMFLKLEHAILLNASGPYSITQSGKELKSVSQDGQKMSLLEGSSIKTGDLSQVTVRFPDLSTLTLEPNSEMVIEKMRRYGNSDAFSIEVLLSDGRAQTQVTPLKHSVSQYEIRTKRILTGVRGTAFSISDRASENALVEVQEGAVAMVDESKVTHLIQAGFGRYSKDRFVSEPISLISLAKITCTGKLSPALDLFEFSTDNTDLDQVVLKIYQLTNRGSEPIRTLVSSSRQKSKELKFPAHLADGQYLLNLQGQDRNGLQGFNASREFSVTSKQMPRRPASEAERGLSKMTGSDNAVLESHTIKQYDCKAS